MEVILRVFCVVLSELLVGCFSLLFRSQIMMNARMAITSVTSCASTQRGHTSVTASQGTGCSWMVQLVEVRMFMFTRTQTQTYVPVCTHMQLCT